MGHIDSFWTLKMAVCLLLVVVLYFAMNQYFFTHLTAPAGLLNRVFYVSIFAMALGALLSSAISSRFWASLSMVFFAMNLLLAASFTKVTDRPMTLTDAQMLANVSDNRSDILSALSQFGTYVLEVLAVVALVIALLIWARTLVRKRSNVPLFVFTLGVVLSYGIRLAGRGDPAVVGLPANFTPGLAACALGVSNVAQKVVPKREASLALGLLPVDPAIRHIVLVIDESIEAEAFATIFHGSRLDHIRNFGVAYSYSNCSAASNLMLRRGVNPMDVDRSLRQLPSLFQLAKQSGFTTAYLDAQDAMRDRFFDPKERSSIDEVPPVESFGPFYERDLNAVPILTDLLNRRQKAFVILNKVGTHFPYSQNLPPEQAGVADPYGASVKRSSVDFLTRLAAALPSGSLVFYTSDHGQNFHGKVAHCNFPGDSTVSEWMVPLVILYSEDMRRIVERFDAGWQNRVSHAALAETLRNLLGYKSPWAGSLMTSPPNGARMHRAFYGAPKPLFGSSTFLIIDESEKAFQGSTGLTGRDTGDGPGQSHSETHAPAPTR